MKPNVWFEGDSMVNDSDCKVTFLTKLARVPLFSNSCDEEEEISGVGMFIGRFNPVLLGTTKVVVWFKLKVTKSCSLLQELSKNSTSNKDNK
jgi:hypothetical protein